MQSASKFIGIPCTAGSNPALSGFIAHTDDMQCHKG